MNRKNYIITFIILFILFLFALFVRLYRVDTAPSGILVDEASFGYNAYSILKTGKDEFGMRLPLVFEAFGDQKLPLYTYLLVPFIKIFSLSALSVRLPSVLAGALLPIVIFFLLRVYGLNRRISMLGGLITAITPWMILLSRFGYESNMGLLFFTLGLLCMLTSIRKKSITNATLAGIFFGLTLYSYVSYRFITPLIIGGFALLTWRSSNDIAQLRNRLIISFVLIMLPLISIIFTHQSIARFNQVSFNYSSGVKMEIDENRTYCSQKFPKTICYLTSNKFLFNMRSYLYRYISSFSPQFLFMSGDTNNISLRVDNFGLFYVWMLPFYLIGVLSVIKRYLSQENEVKDFILYLGLLVTTIPSVLVGEAHILRISALFPFILILLAYGVNEMETNLKTRNKKRVFRIIFITTSILSASYFLILFLTVHIQKHEIEYRTYVPKLMDYLSRKKNSQIYIRSITEGIIYYAFINKVDPQFYQSNIVRKKPDILGFIHTSDLSNIHITEEDFHILSCKLKASKVDALYVSHENVREIPNEAKHIIYSENGVDTLAIVYDLSRITSEDLGCIKPI